MKRLRRKRRKVTVDDAHIPTATSDSEESVILTSESDSCTDDSEDGGVNQRKPRRRPPMHQLSQASSSSQRELPGQQASHDPCDVSSDGHVSNESSESIVRSDGFNDIADASNNVSDENIVQSNLNDDFCEPGPDGDNNQAEGRGYHVESDESGGTESPCSVGDTDASFDELWMSDSESSDIGSDSDEEDRFINLPNSGSESESEDESEDTDNESEPEESGREEATSSEDEAEAEGDEGNQPLYDGAPITLHESMLAIFSLAIAEQISGVLLSKVLELIALHCPANSLCKRTLHTLKKYFAKVGKSVLVFHYFCSNCVFPLKTEQSKCKKCKNSGNYSFFIEMPLLQQLQTLFQRPRFFDAIQYRFNRNKIPTNIEDIYDGRLYTEQMENNGFLSSPQNISFMWWSDGVQIFKSSTNSSIWPLCLVINELSYEKRILPRNIILAGLWFGKAQPNPNIFLTPLRKSMQQFSSVGYKLKLADNTEIVVKGKVLCGTCDLPAKSKFMRFKQFNGTSSCSKCLCAGMRYALPGKPGKGGTTVQVFPYSKNNVARTHDQVQDFARQALDLRKSGDRNASVHGVKGPSLLSYILPDIVRGMAIDVMHGAFLGVCKWLMHFWFEPKFSTFPWSLHASIDVIDSRIRNMKPPVFVQRPLRSIKLALPLWKASEYKLFLLYYSTPVLLGIMNDDYFKHHCKLVSGIALLCQDSISKNHLQSASELLCSYVSDFAKMYQLRYLGMVFHQLIHLGDVVRELGPLWVYSCFFLESFNGKIGKLFHGTRHVALQICSSINLVMKMPLLVESLPQNSLVKKFCHSATYRKDKCKIADQISYNVFAVGTYSDNTLPVQSSKCLLSQYFGRNVHGCVRLFYRLKKDGVMYFSQEYRRSLTGCKEASYVVYNHNNVPCIGRIVRFVKYKDCSPQCNNVCAQNCATMYFFIVREYTRELWYPHDNPEIRLPHLFKVKSSNNVRSIPVENITCSIFYMKVGQDHYVAKPLNSVEPE